MILAQKENQTIVPVGKLLIFLSIIFIAIISLTVGQDFLESLRNNSSFYIEESLLFKVIWLLFIPILTLSHQVFQKVRLNKLSKTITFILTASVIHLLAVSIIVVGFSTLFFEARYDLYKVFSYTLAQDLYKIVMVYACFSFIHSYFLTKPSQITQSVGQPADRLMVSTGKNKIVIYLNQITKITSATPYINIYYGDNEYLHTETLKSFYQKLDSEMFVQIHKTTIVNINEIATVKSRLNGDYDLQLKNGESIRLSRTYVEDFKKKFGLGHRDTI